MAEGYQNTVGLRRILCGPKATTTIPTTNNGSFIFVPFTTYESVIMSGANSNANILCGEIPSSGATITFANKTWTIENNYTWSLSVFILDPP